MTTTDEPTRSPAASLRGRNILSGVLTGVGIAAFVDETVFHQILHWHHFYDGSTLDAGLVSDGIFHAGGWFAVVAGLFLVADLRRRRALAGVRWTGAVLLGAGVFQVYDGTIQHKLLRLHQIRYVPDVAPYDTVWIATGAVLVVVGALMLLRARRG